MMTFSGDIKRGMFSVDDQWNNLDEYNQCKGIQWGYILGIYIYNIINMYTYISATFYSNMMEYKWDGSGYEERKQPEIIPSWD